MPASVVYDESTKAFWFDEADEPVDIETITTLELVDAVNLSGYILPDGGLDHGGDEQRVDDSDLLSAHDNEAIGRYGFKPSLMLKRKLRTGAEVAWTTFKVRKQVGTLVVFETLAPGAAIAAGAAYKAYPECESGSWIEQNVAKNQVVRGKVNFAVGAEPVYGTIAAGS